ncbi:DUF421 domain-containing protein [Cytobacillus purgationiresistens]|uniref:Uncharacterized membrane protein YcaP (DUF421 family) n=1 Tax=Cytobacillus purgationiresistens TaxID=863449 RepID=A0ABU0AF32_9BACI|nr:DUF421 domain-containing protein [Cytobacillus purgationiresistens]MDQ0269867.1 uncharacterized membrane protein YcaP (DUF421 family) [Cytobacillus purgationiresistens]
MEEYLIVIFRTLFLYGLIISIYRIMGKREIGELSILDLVISIMIAELAVVAIEKSEESLFRSVLPMLILMIVQIILAFWSLKSKKLRDVIDGSPTIIINKGKIDENAMKKQRYNFDDLLLQLREKNIARISDVEYAILESSGSLSVFEKTPGENEPTEITVPLIMDGNIQHENLTVISKNEVWLREELRKRGYTRIEKISFCSFENQQFYIDIKDEK